MKILDWEKIVEKEYKVEKVYDIEDLKPYLTSPKNYENCFTVYDITETEILNENFFAAYVFDEREISKRDVISYTNSGWTTLIIFIETLDGENISNYFMHFSNVLEFEEVDKFLEKIKIKEI